MSDNAPKSIQDILKARRQERFIGRDDHLQHFKSNLEAPVESRRFVFAVHGPGGIGKSTLLNRFREICRQSSAVSALAEEGEREPLSAMRRIALDCGQQERSLKGFDTRYEAFRRWRDELALDPQAPRGAGTYANGSRSSGAVYDRRTPVAGLTPPVKGGAETLLAAEMNAYTAWMQARNADRSDVELVQDPVAVLTRLLLTDLAEVIPDKPIVLFFDAYESTSEYLDPWLRDVLLGRYGPVPLNCMLVIAGRDDLDENDWEPFEALLSRIRLDPFSVAEARTFLALHQITDEEVVEEILRRTGRLPLLMAMQAAAKPTTPEQVEDLANVVVDRLLRNVDDPRQRQIALDGAIPRRLDRDVVALLANSEDADELFAWLTEKIPFVLKRGDDWVYHAVVREPMVRHARQRSQRAWSQIHSGLASYYEQLNEKLALSEPECRRDPDWQHHTLEIIYHKLCQAPQNQLPLVLNDFVKGFVSNSLFVRRSAESILQACEDAEWDAGSEWGRRIVDGVKELDEDRYDAPIGMFRALLKEPHLETAQRAKALDWHGYLLSLNGSFASALESLNEAVELAPTDTEYLRDRGIALSQMGRHEEAIADFDRMLTMQSEVTARVRTLGLRGETYREMGRYEDALADFNLALEHDASQAYVLGSRGQVFEALERYDEALADFDRAIALEPRLAWIPEARAETCRTMGKPEDTLIGFDRALEALPDNIELLAGRARTYLQLGRFKEALVDIDRAVEIRPDLVTIISIRITALIRLGDYTRLIADYQTLSERGDEYIDLVRRELARMPPRLRQKAISIGAQLIGAGPTAMRAMDHWMTLVETDPKAALNGLRVEAFAVIAEARRQLGQTDEAFADYARAIELDPRSAPALGTRGEAYRLTEKFDEALADFDRAIAIDAENPVTFGRRGQVYAALGQDETAMADFDRALALDPALRWVLEARANLSVRLGRLDEMIGFYDRALAALPDDVGLLVDRARLSIMADRPENALADFDRAIELRPEILSLVLLRTTLLRQTGDAERMIADYKLVGERASEYVDEVLKAADPADATSRKRIVDADVAFHGGDAETARAAERWLTLVGTDKAAAIRGLRMECAVNIAEAYRYLGRNDEAMVAYQEAIDADPANPLPYVARAEARRELDELEEALADFDRSIALDADNPVTLANRGLTYRSLERYDEALADLDRAINLDPTLGDAIAERAETFRWLERFDEALADFNRALELDPESVYALGGRGQVYAAQERYDEALADFNAALAVEPESLWVLTERADLFDALERYEDAVADYDVVISLDPDHAYAIGNRGFAYAELERYDEAVADLERALELDPAMGGLRLTLAEVYRRMDRFDDALREFDQAIAENPEPFLFAGRALTYLALGRRDDATADADHATSLEPDDEWIAAVARAVEDDVKPGSDAWLELALD